MIDGKEYAKQMRENAVTDNNGNIIVSEELWQQIADNIEELQVLIGHLTMDNRVLKEKRINLFERLEIVSKARAEAIKEFAEKLKAMLAKYDMYGTLYISNNIDNLVKEMVAGNG